MQKVLVTGAIHETGITALENHKDIALDYRPDLPMDEILNIIEHYHCIITRSETPIQKELIDRAKNMKVIARAAVGIANIDVDYATEKGILVINTPGKNTNSAAELTIGLLLTVIRKITPAHANMNQMKWNRHHFTGIELMNKTIGIIGLGNVGHRVAKFAKGFDMEVLAYDPYIADEIFERHSTTQVDFDTLLEQSDIVTLHTPRNKETIKMIDAEAIGKMKKGVILINAARGGIVDESALLKALDDGHVFAAGIDTWEQEPPKDNPFVNRDNVVMTPHIGASTLEAQIRIAESIASQVPRVLQGEVADFPVNMPQIKSLENNPVTNYTVLAEKLGLFACQFMDSSPNQVKMFYRGSLAKHDCSLIRLSFLKGFLKSTHEYVSYVNAEQRAQSVGLHIEEKSESGFTDYESAVKFVLKSSSEQLKIGGVVFSGPHPRITLLNDFVFETDPVGTILVINNKDKPGMIGLMGTLLGEAGININQFELARNVRGGQAMALIRVDDDIPDHLMETFKTHEDINFVKKISI